MDPHVDTMSAAVESEVEFDIAHVLCTDIVAYSKLLINQQSEQLAKLKSGRSRDRSVSPRRTERQTALYSDWGMACCWSSLVILRIRPNARCS
jgi:hypothetical protein